jgi:organic radical activating enzyme
MTSKKTQDYTWDMEGPNKDEFSLNDTNRKQMRDLLNTTGPGFCLAKWTQVTMHLGNGLTHSCHHPGAHKIPLNELAENPSALHNTNFKKERRKEMLNGQRPKECDFCWRVEDNGEISDRVLKSLPGFSLPHHDKISQLTGDEDIYPTYVEVSFSRVCNFACAYCGPPFSSKWEQEVKQHGPYNIFNHIYNPIKDEEKHYNNNEHNPYIEAFWEWFPEAFKHMHTFRITGGEPLLSKDTFKVLDFLIENPNPNLNFAINSNACPPGDLWDTFIAKVKTLTENGCVKRFELYTSAEATGAQNDFIRDGMNWDLFVKNVERFLNETQGTKVVFMCAFNVLSASTFKPLLEWILELKQRFSYQGFFNWLEEEGYNRSVPNSRTFAERKERSYGVHNRIAVDVPYLRHPQFLDANILSKEMIEKYLIPAIDFMYDNLGHGEWYITQKFDDHECLKLKRNVIGCILKAKQVDDDGLTTNGEIRQNRAKFAYFMKAYGKRRGKDFHEVFPEYADFYNLCMQEYYKMHHIKDKEDPNFEIGIDAAAEYAKKMKSNDTNAE